MNISADIIFFDNYFGLYQRVKMPITITTSTFFSLMFGLSSYILLFRTDDCSAINFNLAASMIHGTVNTAATTGLFLNGNRKRVLAISPPQSPQSSREKVNGLFGRSPTGTKRLATTLLSNLKRVRAQSGDHGQQQDNNNNNHARHQIVPDEWKSSAQKRANKMERLVLQISTPIMYFVETFHWMGPYRRLDFNYVEFAAQLVANAMVAERAADREWWWTGGGAVQEEGEEMEEGGNWAENGKQQPEAMDLVQGINGAVTNGAVPRQNMLGGKAMMGGSGGGGHLSVAAKKEAEKRAKGVQKIAELRREVQNDFKLLNTPGQDQKLIEAGAKLVHALHESDHILKHSQDIADMEKVLEEHQIPLGKVDQFKSLFDLAPRDNLFELRWKVRKLRQEITTTPLSVLQIAADGRNHNFEGNHQRFEEAEQKLNRAQILVNKANAMVDQIFGKKLIPEGSSEDGDRPHRTQSAPSREGHDGQEEGASLPNWRFYTEGMDAEEKDRSGNKRRRSLRRLKPKKTGFEHLN